MNRRVWFVVGLLLILVVPFMAVAQEQDGAKTVTRRIGMAGGGLVQTEAGEAVLAFFAGRLTGEAGSAETVVGRILWADLGQDLTLESTGISAYGPLPDNPNGREVQGTMRRPEGADAPFLMRVVDGGPTGSGQDTVALWVGAAIPQAGTPEAGASSYSAEGILIAGDLEQLSADTPPGAATSTAGTPRP